MECSNCGATSTTKKYPGKVGTLCIPCQSRRVTSFQEDATDDFNRKWEERTLRWGTVVGTTMFYTTCVIVVMVAILLLWMWLW